MQYPGLVYSEVDTLLTIDASGICGLAYPGEYRTRLTDACAAQARGRGAERLHEPEEIGLVGGRIVGGAKTRGKNAHDFNKREPGSV